MSDVSSTRPSAYRGIGSVTEATGEQLGMFDGVCGQVHLQAGSICVTTVTVVALVRLVFVVLPTVRLWRRRETRVEVNSQIHSASKSHVKSIIKCHKEHLFDIILQSFIAQ